MNAKFQALHFAVYGQDYKFEACNRLSNLAMIKDAMRCCLDSEDYTSFCHDVNKELNVEDELDGIRRAIVNYLFNLCVH